MTPSAFIYILREAVQSPRVMPAPYGMHRAPERWQPAAKPSCTEQEKFGKNREQEPGITSAAAGNKPLSGNAAVNRAGGSFAAARVAACSLQRNRLLWVCKNERERARRLCACCHGPGGSRQRKPTCARVRWSRSLCSVHPRDLGMCLVPQGGEGSREKGVGTVLRVRLASQCPNQAPKTILPQSLLCLACLRPLSATPKAPVSAELRRCRSPSLPQREGSGLYGTCKSRLHPDQGRFIRVCVNMNTQ